MQEREVMMLLAIDCLAFYRFWQHMFPLLLETTSYLAKRETMSWDLQRCHQLVGGFMGRRSNHEVERRGARFGTRSSRSPTVMVNLSIETCERAWKQPQYTLARPENIRRFLTQETD